MLALYFNKKRRRCWGVCLVLCLCAHGQATAEPPPPTVHIEAARLHDDGDTIRAHGQVQMDYQHYRLCAQQASFARGAGLLRLDDSVQVKYDELTVDADSAHYDVREERGALHDFVATAENRRLRVSGDALLWQGDVFSAANASISSCADEQKSWQLFAEGVREDRADESIVFDNARLELAGIPVAYLPAASLYYGDDNRSGALPPTFHFRTGGRWGLETPYYVALDDSYDWTITPHWRTTQGVEVANQFRFLTRDGDGEVNINQVVFGDETRARQSLDYKMQRANWRLAIAAQNTSDDFYLRDYGQSNSEKATRNLPRQLSLDYDGDNWSGHLLAASYKTLSEDLQPPHQLLPQLRLRHWGGFGGADWEQEAEYSRFKHRDAAAVSGSRYFWHGEARRHFYPGRFTVTPHIGAQAVKYRNDNSGADDGPAFLIPFAYMDMQSNWYIPNANADVNTDTNANTAADAFNDYLSLRLAWIYAARKEQSRAPLYDTTVKQPSLENLYDVNRFAGGDRFSDDRLFVYSAEYHRFTDGGKPRAYIGIGQRFYLQDSHVGIGSEVLPERGGGDVLVDAKFHFNDNWRLDTDAQWDVKNGTMTRFYGDVRGRLSARRLLQLGVLIEEDENLTAGFSTPLGDDVEFAATSHYLLRDDVFSKTDIFLRLSDAADCWRLTLKFENTFVDEDDYDWEVAVGIELVDLGRVGKDYNTILQDLRNDY